MDRLVFTIAFGRIAFAEPCIRQRRSLLYVYCTFEKLKVRQCVREPRDHHQTLRCRPSKIGAVLSEHKSAARSMPAFDPGRFRSSKHKFKKCRAFRIKYLVKSVSYKFCTKFAKSVGWRKTAGEKEFWASAASSQSWVYVKGPCLLGILRAYKATENFGRGRVGGGRETRFQHSLAGIRSGTTTMVRRGESQRKGGEIPQKFAEAPEPRKRSSGKYARIE